MKFSKFKSIFCNHFVVIGLILLFSETTYGKDVQIEYQDLMLNAAFTHNVNDIKDSRIFLILHGTLGHGKMEIVKSMQALLHEEGEKVLAITLSLGLNDRKGMYDCSLPHNHQHEDAQGELTKWVDWLIKHEAQEIILVGHSRGAMQVAEYLANTNKKQIQAAVLLAPPIMSKNLLNSEIRPVTEEGKKTVSGQEYFNIDRFLHCQESFVSSTSLYSYYGDPASGTDIFKTIKQITRPTIVFLGTADPIVDLTLWSEQTEFNDNITVHTIEGAGHFFRDLYLYDVADELLTWLE